MHEAKDSLVSIIMPAYRASAVIGESIDSVISQSYMNWELIISDDCSPDNTREVISRYSKQDARIIPVFLDKNGGPAKARNASLAIAKGRYVAFLDSDDIWLPDKLLLQLSYMQENNEAFTYTGFRRITQSGDSTGHLIDVLDKVDYNGLLRNTTIATSTVVIDKDMVGEVVMRDTYYDDLVCWLEILKIIPFATGIQKDLVRYRVMDESVSRNKKNSAIQVWKTYREIERLGILKSAWVFMHYAINAWLKYRSF